MQYLALIYVGEETWSAFDSDTRAGNASLGMLVERAATPVGRRHAAFDVLVARQQGNTNSAASDERHVALATEERLAGNVDGDE